MLVTEPHNRLPLVVAQAINGGVNVVQLRHQFSDELPLAEGLAVLDATDAGGACLLLNGTPVRTRRPIGGIHLKEAELAGADRLHKMFGCVVGRSIHSVESALRAVAEGVDYLIAGTIYPSQSHPGEPVQGVEFVRQVCEAVAPLPVIAIGGITPERVGACIAAGAAGVAVLSPIMRAADPRAVAQAYRIELDKAWSLRSTENR